jgi:tRNA pseudouridine65 synthase
MGDKGLAGDMPQILFENEAVVAVHKPSGMAVHRGWARDRFVLADWYLSQYDVNTAYPLGRLDRGTSGIVFFARTAAIAGEFQSEGSKSQVTKSYLALVRGVPPESGIIDHPISRREGGPRVPSVTRYRTLGTAFTVPRHVSLVEATPETGRLHQIRRHLKHINHPIIGDSNYGRTELNRDFRAGYGLGRLALHAGRATVTLPGKGERVVVFSPLPEDLAEPFQKMGFSPSLWT